MTVKNDLTSTMTAKGFLHYQEDELKAVVGNDRFFVFLGDKLIARENKAAVIKRLEAIPGRVYTKDGVPWEVSVPDTIKAAMIDHGLMGSAKEAHKFLRGALHPVLREMTAWAHTQTTENGQRKYIKATPIIIAAPTHNTRGGDPEVGWALFVLTKAVSFDNRPVALDHRLMSYAQGPAQAVWNHDIGRRLLNPGILVLPKGKSTAAIGYAAQSQGTARLQAAGAGKSSAKRKKATAKGTRPKKQTVPWDTALHNFVATVKREITDAVSVYATNASDAARKRMAFRAVRRAFRYHAQSGSPRFSEASVRATAHALATPHVGVKMLDAAFKRVVTDLDKVGVRVVKDYTTGNRMFSSAAQQSLEQQLGTKLSAAMRHRTSGGSPRAVIQALAGNNLTAVQYSAAIDIAGPGRVVFADARKPQAIAHAADVFRYHKKDVYVIGDKAAGRALNAPNFSLSGFLDSTTRTGHLRSLWLGLRSECWLTGSPLRAAEQIRACKPRIQLKKNSMIVLSPTGLEDAKAISRLLKLADKRDCKVVFKGPHASLYQSMARSRGMTP